MIFEDEDKIKDLFSSKLQSFEPELPASLWGGIDQALSQQNAPTPSGSESASSSSASSSSSSTLSSSVSTVGKTIMWLKPIAAVASTIALAVATVFIYNIVNKDVPASMEPSLQNVINVDSIFNNIDTIIEAPSQPLAKALDTKLSDVIDDKDTGTQNTFGTTETDSKMLIDTSNYDTKPINENEVNQGAKSLALRTKVKKLPMYYKRKGFTFGVFSSVPLSVYNKNQQGGILTFSDPDNLNTEFIQGDNFFKMKHSKPISFGLTISKDISSNLSLETGIIYTQLSSTINVNNDYIFREKQKFYYLGIPISINYTIFRFRELNIYLSFGGMIQKDIKGKYTGSLKQINGTGVGVFNNTEYRNLMSIKNNISQSNPQFSTHLNLGVIYPIYRGLYLYGTVGGIYYFDASNEYRTIYSDKPTQFDVTAGLKFKF